MNTGNICIRELRPDDSVGVITELLHSAYAPLAAMGFKYLATHQDEATTRQRLQSGISIVAELDGRIVGTVTLRAPKSESRCAWYLQPGVWSFGQFAVRPDLQRNGLGEKMLCVIEQHALQHHATELALDTAEGATHLVHWYERLGFRFIQHVSWEDTNYRSVVMSKRLTALNPWLRIPLSDYEGHMSMPGVAQAQMLTGLLRRVVDEHQPASLAVLGASGGNGLEAVDAAAVRRVVAIDFNPEYVEACAARYGGRFSMFQSVLHDLSQSCPPIETVECVFAGLLLEYLNVAPFCDELPAMLVPGGIFAVVLQRPSPDLPEVSESPFTSLRQLAPGFRIVDPSVLIHTLRARGLHLIHEEDIHLPSGKSFYFAIFQLEEAGQHRRLPARGIGVT